MPTTIRWSGTREELIAALHRIPAMLAGKLPDPHGAVRGLLLRVALVLLGRIQDAYLVKSSGGTDAMGVSWPALSPVTLLLRHRGGVNSKQLARLHKQVAGLSRTDRLRLRKLERQQRAVLQGATSAARAAKRQALRIVERKQRKGLLSPTRYKALKRLLTGKLTTKQVQSFALAQASALILRDTGALLNSLGPALKGSGDQILKVDPGEITVGSNIHYLKYHQSSQPRQLNAAGVPKLPRRQVLPDDTHPIPQEWWEAMTAEFAKGIASREFLVAVLGPKAA